MLKIKQILFGAIVIGQACSTVHAVDSDDLKQYGTIGASVVSLLLGAHMGKIAYRKHRALRDPLLLEIMIKEGTSETEDADLLAIRKSSFFKDLYAEELTKERNIGGGISGALIAGGAYGLSRSLRS